MFFRKKQFKSREVEYLPWTEMEAKALNKLNWWLILVALVVLIFFVFYVLYIFNVYDGCKVIQEIKGVENVIIK